MRITSKGQVTIPAVVRDEFGFKPGTEVEFITEDGKVVLRPSRERRSPVESWLRSAVGVSRGKRTTAEIMRMTRGER